MIANYCSVLCANLLSLFTKQKVLTIFNVEPFSAWPSVTFCEGILSIHYCTSIWFATSTPQLVHKQFIFCLILFTHIPYSCSH